MEKSAAKDSNASVLPNALMNSAPARMTDDEKAANPPLYFLHSDHAVKLQFGQFLLFSRGQMSCRVHIRSNDIQCLVSGDDFTRH
jgi:hypothetical protein